MTYKSVVVGDYVTELIVIVNDSVLLPIKAAKSIEEIHPAQILNYLKAIRLDVGFILNFDTQVHLCLSMIKKGLI